jgi:hypothetical protein
VSKRLLPIVLLSLLAVLAPSAARAQKVSAEFDQSVDFTKYKTFIVRDGQVNSKNPAINGELAKKNLQTEIENDLMARGLTKVATGPADLNLFFTFGAARKVETETYPAGWRGLRTRVARVPYAEGTLVIDLRDPSTRSLVWQGTATDEEKDPTKVAAKLNDMAKKAIAKYPPKK